MNALVDACQQADATPITAARKRCGAGVPKHRNPPRETDSISLFRTTSQEEVDPVQAAAGLSVRVVSMPNRGVFERQPRGWAAPGFTTEARVALVQRTLAGADH